MNSVIEADECEETNIQEFNDTFNEREAEQIELEKHDYGWFPDESVWEQYIIPEPADPMVFPLACLPEVVQRYVQSVSTALNVPDAIPALGALSVMGASIGNSRVIRLNDTWIEPSVIYGAVVAESGQMKSPALNRMSKPLQVINCKEVRTWISDATVEKIRILLMDHKRGLLMKHDELTAWVKALNQYKGGHGADTQFFLSVWDCSPATVDRVGRDSIDLARPFLCVIGNIPPSELSQLCSSEGSGFMQRILLAWPRPIPPSKAKYPFSKVNEEDYETLIRNLFGLSFEDSPTELTLAPDAQSLFDEWEYEFNMEGFHAPGDIRPYYSKLKGYCARFALIHALGADPMAKIVPLASVNAAIGLTRYFLQTAKRSVACRLSVQGRAREINNCKGEIVKYLTDKGNTLNRPLQRNSNFPTDIYKQALWELQFPSVIIKNGCLTLSPVGTDYRQPTNGSVSQ